MHLTNFLILEKVMKLAKALKDSLMTTLTLFGLDQYSPMFITLLGVSR
jgi:hypothetical protein